MEQEPGYLIALATFAGNFLYLRRHPGWSRSDDERPYSAPGWRKPLAVVLLSLLDKLTPWNVIAAGAEAGRDESSALRFALVRENGVVGQRVVVEVEL